MVTTGPTHRASRPRALHRSTPPQARWDTPSPVGPSRQCCERWCAGPVSSPRHQRGVYVVPVYLGPARMRERHRSHQFASARAKQHHMRRGSHWTHTPSPADPASSRRARTTSRRFAFRTAPDILAGLSHTKDRDRGWLAAGFRRPSQNAERRKVRAQEASDLIVANGVLSRADSTFGADTTDPRTLSGLTTRSNSIRFARPGCCRHLRPRCRSRGGEGRMSEARHDEITVRLSSLGGRRICADG